MPFSPVSPTSRDDAPSARAARIYDNEDRVANSTDCEKSPLSVLVPSILLFNVIAIKNSAREFEVDTPFLEILSALRFVVLVFHRDG
jgi:hypothetical protein